MRVVHANKAYFPHLGGVETVVRNLAEGTLERGHEVAVVTGDGPGPAVVGGVSVHRARCLATVRSVPVAPGYPLGLLRESGDVLHIHEPSILPESVLAASPKAVRRRFGRVVLSWHSDIVRQRRLKRVVEPILRRALHCTDVVLAATPRHLEVSPLLQNVAQKVQVVPFGIDPSRYEASPAVTERAAQLRARFGTPLVLFLGRLVYYKGVSLVLEAAEAMPDARFVLVGSGPLEREVQTSVAFRRGQLALLRPVDEEEKVSLLHACDVFVLPSTDISEAYGIVQVEAMACAKPVVTFDLPTGVTWVNRDGVTGRVAALAKDGSLQHALSELLSDRELAARLGAAARERVLSELTLSRQVQLTLAAYS